MKALQRALVGGLIVAMGFCGMGCGNKFFDPTQIGRFRPTPAVNIILDSLGVAEEAPSPWEDATEPMPQDLLTNDTDYKLGSGDVVTIAIYELLNEAQMVTNNYVINESGKVSIPEAGIVQAAGLSETELEQRLRDILSPDILPNPTVSVTLINSQRRQCSVVGDGVARPNRFLIPRHNFRLTDVLALAGGANQFNVSNIYVARTMPVETETASVQPSFSGHPIAKPLKTMTPPGAQASMGEFGRLPKIYRPHTPSFPSVQQERQMLGMGTEMTQRLWSESQKLVPTNPSWHTAMAPEVISPVEFPQTQHYGFVNPGMTTRDLPAMTAMPSPAAPGNAVATGANGPQIEWVFENGKWKPITRTPMSTTGPAPVTQVPRTHQTIPTPRPVIPSQPTAPADTGTPQVEWVFQDGRWIPVQARRLAPGGPTYEFGQDPSVLPLNGQQTTVEPEGWEASPQTRLIRIPKDRLMAGDQNYNIIIKPGDTIYVPVDVVGEFYIMGNVNRSGTINMTGRPITLKQAIVMAGGLGPLAFPKKCEITRRIDSNREQTVLVDLDKIASGEQPDFFIKPNDMINVGTHYSSRWRAVLRNSFRAAWGFGMVYDRNFADDKFGMGWPFSL